MNSRIFMRRSVALLALALTAPAARADVTLWYNGDYDNRDATTDQAKVPINNGSGYNLRTTLVYENFVVPVGQTYTITGIFSNDQTAYYAAPTNATWEIRTGMSAGNGGTVVASGDGAATETALSQTPGYYYGATPEKLSESINSVTLTAGNYWVAIAADSTGYYGDQSYLETTSGLNAIGVPTGNDGNSFISTNFTGPGSYNFASTTAAEGAGNWDYSVGIVGTSALISTPAPASLAMFALGLAGASSARMRRRARPVAA